MNRVFQPLAWIAWAAGVSLGACGCTSATEKQAASTPSAADSDEGGARPDSNAARCDALSERLQAALDAAVKAEHLPGVAAAARLGDCSWRGASGESDASAHTPAKQSDLFRVGSITKTFVSTLALMLSAEGKLSLDAPVSTYVDDIPSGDRITVRQLLNHTSGLFDYTESQEFWNAVASDPGRVWAPRELIAFAAGKPLGFDPGEGWSYSNTNYIVAGLVLEAAAGAPVAAELRARVIDPAHLEHTYLDGAEPAVAGLAHGYASDGGALRDTTSAADPSAAGTAGALVSSVDDLTSFYAQLLEGKLLRPREMEEMTTWVHTSLVGMPGYGLGLSERDSALGNALGHNGGIWGFSSASYTMLDHHAAITVLVNLESGDVERVVDDLADVLKAP